MQVVSIEPAQPQVGGLAPLALGFRPFFLAAGVAAVLLLALWVLDYAGVLPLATSYAPQTWHGHEMLFGYTAAVIAGFLLTAVRNWTGQSMPHDGALAVLVAVWFAGRLAPLLPLPPLAVALVDLAFLPLLAVVIGRVLLRAGQPHNLVFVPLLAALAVANGLVHAEVLGYAPGRARLGLYLGLDLIVLLIAIIGGRVFPFFTERALPQAAPRRWPALDAACFAGFGALLLAEPYGAGGGAAATALCVAAALHAVRLWGWYDRRIWGAPLLWILHVGYAWVVVGLLLRAAAAAGLLAPSVALHGFAAGAIGTLTLGMMARVALGHTGRPLRPAPAMTLAFGLLCAAAVLRVGGAALAPDRWYVATIVGAGSLWIAAFAIFVAIYTPILVRRRPDGQPG